MAFRPPIIVRARARGHVCAGVRGRAHVWLISRGGKRCLALRKTFRRTLDGRRGAVLRCRQRHGSSQAPRRTLSPPRHLGRFDFLSPRHRRVGAAAPRTKRREVVPLDEIKRVTVRVEYADGERIDRVIPGDKILEVLMRILRSI